MSMQEAGMAHSESVSSGLGRSSPDTPAEWFLESAVEVEEEGYEDDLWMQDIADEGDIHWVWVSPAICYIPLESEVKHWLNPEYSKYLNAVKLVMSDHFEVGYLTGLVRQFCLAMFSTYRTIYPIYNCGNVYNKVNGKTM